jgi:hypothetical protein
VLITGGYNAGFLSSVEYSLGPRTCAVPGLPKPREYHVAFAFEGKAAVCGGDVDFGLGVKDCLVFNPASQSWEDNKLGDLTVARDGASVVNMANGVYILGGDSGAAERSSELLPAGSKDWIVGPELPVGHSDGCAVAVSDVSFLMIGGIFARRER